MIQLRHPKFFTLDADFYKRNLCHAKYFLVNMFVRKNEAAEFVRRLLRHRQFDTVAKCMGAVIRISHVGLSVWRIHATKETHFGWENEK